MKDNLFCKKCKGTSCVILHNSTPRPWKGWVQVKACDQCRYFKTDLEAARTFFAKVDENFFGHVIVELSSVYEEVGLSFCVSFSPIVGVIASTVDFNDTEGFRKILAELVLDFIKNAQNEDPAEMAQLIDRVELVTVNRFSERQSNEL